MDEGDIDDLLVPRAPPPGMVEQVAMGLFEPREVAYRFGYGDEDWKRLEAWEPFQKAVAAKIAEYKTSGLTDKLILKELAMRGVGEIGRALMSPETTVMQKLEITKALAKWADMEPKANLPVATGAQFSIEINIPKAPTTIDVDARVKHEAEVRPASLSIEFPDERPVREPDRWAGGLDEDDGGDHEDRVPREADGPVQGRGPEVEGGLDP